MARIPVEVGQSFHKIDSWIVWTVDSFNQNTEPVHAWLIRLDDPTTHITVSIDVLSDPRYWSVADLLAPVVIGWFARWRSGGRDQGGMEMIQEEDLTAARRGTPRWALTEGIGQKREGLGELGRTARS